MKARVRSPLFERIAFLFNPTKLAQHVHGAKMANGKTRDLASNDKHGSLVYSLLEREYETSSNAGVILNPTNTTGRPFTADQKTKHKSKRSGLFSCLYAVLRRMFACSR